MTPAAARPDVTPCSSRARLARTVCAASFASSSILAIAAAKLGGSPIAAYDVDADSVKIARENAEQNGVADKIVNLPRNERDLPNERVEMTVTIVE